MILKYSHSKNVIFNSHNFQSVIIFIIKRVFDVKIIFRAANSGASGMTYWLKNYNLWQVHNITGHKYISSTERYQLNNLDKLQSRFEKYHPLNNN